MCGHPPQLSMDNHITIRQEPARMDIFNLNCCSFLVMASGHGHLGVFNFDFFRHFDTFCRKTFDILQLSGCLNIPKKPHFHIFLHCDIVQNSLFSFCFRECLKKLSLQFFFDFCNIFGTMGLFKVFFFCLMLGFLNKNPRYIFRYI